MSSFRFLWPCVVSKVWRERKNQQDATIRCLLSTSVSTCYGHHYAHLQENKDRVTAYGVLLWFCWMWLVAVVGRCVVGCEHCEGFCSTLGVDQKPMVLVMVSLCRLRHCLSLHNDTTPPQPNHTVTPTHIEPEQYTHTQSQAPKDECTSIRNMLSKK